MEKALVPAIETAPEQRFLAFKRDRAFPVVPCRPILGEEFLIVIAVAAV